MRNVIAWKRVEGVVAAGVVVVVGGSRGIGTSDGSSSTIVVGSSSRK